MDAQSLLERTTPAGRQAQLFSTQLERFCPAEHCSKRCGPTDCTCRPCLPGCRFCAERKTAHAPPFVIQPTFEHRQLRLINDFTAINQRRTK